VRAAESGLPEAEYRVACCYLDATGVPANRAEAVRWLERAAQHGHLEAQLRLAIACLQGWAGERQRRAQGATGLFGDGAVAGADHRAAVRWARLAAEAGSSEAQALLAFILSAGPQDIRDLGEADLWYRRSAAAGCPQGLLGHALALIRQGHDAPVGREVIDCLSGAAQAGLPAALYLLGVTYERGFGVTRDRVMAVQFYRRAAENGHCISQFRWGQALLRGVGVDADPLAGETWLRRAALGGNLDAAALLGEHYATQGIPAGHGETVGRLQRAADSGDAAAPAAFARALLAGLGNEEDRARICQQFEEGAVAGDPVAAFNYAVCLTHGLGVERDDEQAAKWLHKAAAHLPQAQWWYGRALVEGRGVGRDLTEGRSFIARAAAADLIDAQVALAEMMLKGAGGDREPEGAIALFERAAASGHRGAMFAAGVVRAGGYGVPPDPAAARHWFRVAAAQGHGRARAVLERWPATTAGDRDDRAHEAHGSTAPMPSDRSTRGSRASPACAAMT
jgi:hypothetical protein